MKCFALLLSILALFYPLCPAAASATAEPPAVYLTFDDGPTDSTTPKVLDILHEKGVRATFFVIGRQIAGREKTLRRTACEGHAIGIHSYSHRYEEIYRSEGALLRDIEQCRRAILAVLPRYDRKIYRFPGGSFLCPALRDAVTGAGYRYYDWNAATGDAEGKFTADELLHNAIETSRGKEPVVLLLHDGVGYRETIAALPRIIDYFRGRGYRFRTL